MPMSQSKSTEQRLQFYAKLAGAMYLLTMATALFSEAYVRGTLYVGESAEQTTRNLVAANQLFRLALGMDLITFSGVVVLVWALYQLLKNVNAELAALAAFFRLVEIGVHISAVAFGVTALSLLARGEYTQGFQDSQLSGLVGLLLRTQGTGLGLGFVPLGLGSAIFAYLLMTARYVPRALAAWGVFASLLLALYAFGVVLSAATRDFLVAAMLPMFLYEVGLGLWLLLKGVNVREGAT